MALTQVPSGMIADGAVTPAKMANSGYEFGMRNRIINGDMRIAQRSLNYTLTSAIAYGSLDRWSARQIGATTGGIFNQLNGGSGLAGLPYAMRFGRSAGATNTGVIEVIQAVETLNSLSLQGQTVTLSFYALKSANYSGGNMTVILASGTGTDQSAASLGSWTGVNYAVNTSQALTTSWVRYTFTATIPSNATQVGVYFNYTPSGTAGTDDSIYMTGVQLELGSVATPFEHRPYGTELALCQRYYYRNTSLTTYAPIGVGRAWSTSNGNAPFFLPVPMRSSPTVGYSALANFDVVGLGNPTAITNDGCSNQAVKIGWARTGATSGAFYQIEFGGSTGYWLDFSAEL